MRYSPDLLVVALALAAAVGTGTAAANNTADFAGFGGKPSATSPPAHPLSRSALENQEEWQRVADLTQVGKPTSTTPHVQRLPDEDRQKRKPREEDSGVDTSQTGKPTGTSPHIQRR